MNKDIVTFEEKIKSSFKKHLRLPAIGLLFTLLTVLLLINVNNQYIIPNKAYNIVQKRFETLIKNVEMTIDDAITQDYFLESLETKDTSIYSYTNLFYQLTQNTKVNLDFVILDTNHEPIYATRNIFDNSVYVSAYNKVFSERILASNHIEIGSINLSEILSQKNALAIGKTIKINNQEEATFIVYIDPASTQTLIDQYYVNYVVVTDEFGYVVSSSNDFFSDRLNRFNPKETREIKIENLTYQDYIKHSQQLVFHMLNVKTTFLSKYGLMIVFLIIGYYILKITQEISGRSVGEEISVSINELKEAIKIVQEGQIGYQSSFEADDEMVYLIEAFNEMSKKLDKQIKDNESLLILKNEARIKQLEAQFNPHFLYNSLETIKYLIHLDPNKATEMILNLNYLLRYSIDVTKQEVSLHEDITSVIQYLEIIKIRLGDRFTYDINISDKVLETKVPRLLIQPLIENSVKHGFQEKDDLNISVFGFEFETSVYIGIYDDGGGMDTHQLKQLQETIKEEENIENAFGLHNLYQRLRLLYGSKADMRINSFDGMMNVIIKIPQGE